MAPTTPDAYWIALRSVRGVGPRTCRLLLERFESAESIFKASEDEIAAAGVTRPVARAIASFSDFAPMEKELCELPRLGASLVRWTDANYPRNLKQIADPPPYLIARGTLAPDDTMCIAVVGARAASDAGLRMANRLGFELAAHGFIVVSGLARGIDGAAHQGALEAGGRTIAVLGCGIDVAYPPEHRKLTDTIVDSGGVVLSELPLGTAPMPENFPSRNRILSGLSLGVVIVEAAEKSGSLITARMALEQNRQVFAVPGSPLTGRTRGSNRLLREGAVLVECVEDVIEDLAPQLAAMTEVPSRPTAGAAPSKLELASQASATVPRAIDARAAVRAPKDGLTGFAGSDSEHVNAILRFLSDTQKRHVDAIIESSQLSPQIVLKLLLELELRGLVVQHPGKLFSLP